VGLESSARCVWILSKRRYEKEETYTERWKSVHGNAPFESDGCQL
jgi:hypothetical protein